MPKRKSLYLETTKVPAERTAGEISSVLIQHGATRIEQLYENKQIVGLKWSMKVHGTDVSYSMPVRSAAICKMLTDAIPALGAYSAADQKERRRLKVEAAKEQADRIAWRQLFRWVQAQLAMMDLGMVEAREVFMPYMLDRSGQTLFSLFEAQKFKMLEAPKQ